MNKRNILAKLTEKNLFNVYDVDSTKTTIGIHRELESYLSLYIVTYNEISDEILYSPYHFNNLNNFKNNKNLNILYGYILDKGITGDQSDSIRSVVDYISKSMDAACSLLEDIKNQSSSSNQRESVSSGLRSMIPMYYEPKLNQHASNRLITDSTSLSDNHTMLNYYVINTPTVKTFNSEEGIHNSFSSYRNDGLFPFDTLKFPFIAVTDTNRLILVNSLDRYSSSDFTAFNCIYLGDAVQLGCEFNDNNVKIKNVKLLLENISNDNQKRVSLTSLRAVYSSDYHFGLHSVNESVRLFGNKTIKTEILREQRYDQDLYKYFYKVTSSKFRTQHEVVEIEGVKFALEDFELVLRKKSSDLLVNYAANALLHIASLINDIIEKHSRSTVKKGDIVKFTKTKDLLGLILPDKKYEIQNVYKVNKFVNIVEVICENNQKLKLYSNRVKKVENE